MSLVIILYMAVLSAFILGHGYKGVSLFNSEKNAPGQNRIRFTLKAQDTDEVNYEKFRKHDAKLSAFIGLLYLGLAGITFLLVPNLWGSLTTREIHLIRTCVIAILVLHFSREMWLATVREQFIIRHSRTEITRYDLKTAGPFVVLSVALIYSIYIQMTYSW